MTGFNYTVDWDDDAEAWIVVQRDETNMRLDEFGPFDSKAKAARSAANRRYADANPRVAKFVGREQ